MRRAALLLAVSAVVAGVAIYVGTDIVSQLIYDFFSGLDSDLDLRYTDSHGNSSEGVFCYFGIPEGPDLAISVFVQHTFSDLEDGHV